MPIEPDKLLASATTFLIQGQEFYEAGILLLCNGLDLLIEREYWEGADLGIELSSSRAIYDIIQNDEHPSTYSIRQAFRAVLPSSFRLEYIRCRVDFPDYDSDWRTKLLDVIEGKVPLNQGVPIQDKPRFQWEYLYFRSPHEIAIAKALNGYNVLFLPNCMARFAQERQNKEADFLVCYEGKWGIIEVDGAFHTSAARDHERDRLFKSHGIRVIERYTASQCVNDPKGVVGQFLELLKKNG